MPVADPCGRGQRNTPREFAGVVTLVGNGQKSIQQSTSALPGRQTSETAKQLAQALIRVSAPGIFVTSHVRFMAVMGTGHGKTG